ncbi:hypothetical protein HA402_010393 [Bradysia odoriphaga]|nr:hypothetical protein HA402_010393 [Bradysia odoriphaga]
MRDDHKVVLLGEDIGRLGGVFRITDGLLDEFGAQRVIDTPLAESGIVGTAVGLAFRGYRPVVEIQFDGFVYPAFDQIVSQVAKLHYRTQGRVKMPITIRIPWAGGIGAAEHHSESPEAYFVHTAGLRVIAVSNPEDAYRSLRQAIASDDPVIFFEPKRLYHHKGDVDLEAPLADAAPMGLARVVRQGTDATIIAYGAMVSTALQAAEAAHDEGTSLEVIDLRSISPVDYDSVAASVRKTGRVVVAHEASREAGVAAEVIASITERCFEPRHPVPAREAREVSPARPRPPARRRRPSAGPTEQPDGSGRMITEFRLPDLGEGLTEAEVVQWLVAPGDTVTLNQTLAEVETAKAVVELPSPYEGTVETLHAEAGETIAVGAPLIAFDVAGEEPAAPDVDAAQKQQPNLVGYGAAPSASGRPARRARRVASAPASTADTAVLEAAPHDARPRASVEVVVERPRSTPPVRAYAKRLGVDLVLVAAEVGDRVITRDDIDAYAARVGTPVPVAEAVPVARLVETERETRVPIRGVRKHTAAAMVQSAFTAPHVTVFLTVDVTATMGLISSLREDRALADHRIGPLAVVAKAVCLALGRAAGLNAHWDEAAGEIVQHNYVDLGIAAATDRGLIVPYIRDAERLTLPALADAITALAATARSGKTTPADLAGGTFSISNIGVFGVDAGTPILPPGQSGILAIGAVRRQPWEHHGEIALRDVMTLSLSFDHRLVDGADGARFLKDVADVLQEPGRAMLLS